MMYIIYSIYNLCIIYTMHIYNSLPILQPSADAGQPPNYEPTLSLSFF